MSVVDRVERPADNHPGEQIYDDGEVQLSTRRTDYKLCGVTDPPLVRCLRLEASIQVLPDAGRADPFAILLAGSVLLMVATLATWLPSRRASLVPPIIVLRDE